MSILGSYCERHDCQGGVSGGAAQIISIITAPHFLALGVAASAASAPGTITVGFADWRCKCHRCRFGRCRPDGIAIRFGPVHQGANDNDRREEERIEQSDGRHLVQETLVSRWYDDTGLQHQSRSSGEQLRAAIQRLMLPTRRLESGAEVVAACERWSHNTLWADATLLACPANCGLFCLCSLPVLIAPAQRHTSRLPSFGKIGRQAWRGLRWSVSPTAQ